MAKKRKSQAAKKKIESSDFRKSKYTELEIFVWDFKENKSTIKEFLALAEKFPQYITEDLLTIALKRKEINDNNEIIYFIFKTNIDLFNDSHYYKCIKKNYYDIAAAAFNTYNSKLPDNGYNFKLAIMYYSKGMKNNGEIFSLIVSKISDVKKIIYPYSSEKYEGPMYYLINEYINGNIDINIIKIYFSKFSEEKYIYKNDKIMMDYIGLAYESNKLELAEFFIDEGCYREENLKYNIHGNNICLIYMLLAKDNIKLETIKHVINYNKDFFKIACDEIIDFHSWITWIVENRPSFAEEKIDDMFVLVGEIYPKIKYRFNQKINHNGKDISTLEYITKRLVNINNDYFSYSLLNSLKEEGCDILMPFEDENKSILTELNENILNMLGYQHKETVIDLFIMNCKIKCMICLEEGKTLFKYLKPCGHVAICVGCFSGDKIKTCPVCKSEYQIIGTAKIC